MQEEIIQSVLEGRDTLALLPTGGGKSICFQVPAMAKEGLCLVISPLIALMKDQVENLRRKNITAFAVYSGMSRKEVTDTLKVAANSNCKFLYVSPERLETRLFREYLPAFRINLIAVDEAHCISQWGYDFRPPYLRIAALREELPGIPVLALTASATREVQQDICEKLQFLQPVIFRQSFERQNLSFSVFKVDSKINKIIQILNKVAGSGIIYCRSRKHTKEISDILNMYGIHADFYHAGLLHGERARRQEDWIKNKTRVIVCTNAFGMGIDKPDVRVVIHAGIPDCLENYYQEAGRAGRDGKKAYAVLLYAEQELNELVKLPEVRFPSLENIRLIYQALVNYLQVPTGSGEDLYYDFDISDFIKKFKLDTYQTLYTLKTLEQEAVLAFNEQVFIPARVYFTVNKQGLYDFEKTNPRLEPLIKALLRTYSGIFDQQVAIHERTIAGLLRKPVDEVIRDLQTLGGNGIIEYIPQKDKPQLYFMQARVKAEELQIDQLNYKKRKERFQNRIRALLTYVQSESACRSEAIAKYFGDETAKPCGVCDNCLKKKNNDISEEEFEQIRQKLIGMVKDSAVPADQLFGFFEGVKKDKFWQVINYLQAENKLVVDRDGMVRGAG